MAIRPGICPPEGCGTPTARECIEAVKVFDSCLVDEQIGQCVRVADVCPSPIPEGSTIVAEPLLDTARCFFIGFGGFNPPFFRATRVLLTIDISVSVFAPDGTLICQFVQTLQEIARGFLWAPPNTFVQCEVLSIGGGGCELATDPATGDQIICCRRRFCAAIRVKGIVNLLVAGFGECELEPCTGEPDPGFRCPTTVGPPQVCAATPTVAIQNDTGMGISDLDVTFTRTADGAVFSVTRTTNAAGEVEFPEIGGIVASFDRIEFTLAGKTVVFIPPASFTDVNGVLHDSPTICRLIFRQVAEHPDLFVVLIDGVQMEGTIDP